ncbi:protein transport protein SEC31-like isoform X1 [Biomphalaria glabrata]|nr:protein transport protein SEC31-like isoform X1 [Biomphalaria glabrata]
MAEMLQRVVFFCILIHCLLCVVSVGGLARRGGRGSSRSYGHRTSTSIRSTTKIKVKHNVVLSGRIVRGSSIYTSSNWRAAFYAGAIYGGTRHVHMHPNTMPTICTNRFERRPDGLVYGYFICPKDNDLMDEIYCCGPDNREYCCNKTMAEVYYYKHYHSQSGGPSVGAIVGIIIAVVIVVGLAAFCCKKRKHAGQIIRKFSKRGGRSKQDYHGPQAVPLSSPELTNGDSTTITQAPPSYAAATTVGYDGSQQYPYSGPQPFPPGAPQPYPPYNGIEDKSGQLPPEIVAGEPYKPYPSDGPAPYPIMPNGSENIPYPPPSGSPYPPPEGTPYPPGAPYPPPGSTPYPPPGAAPYPPPGGAPYPPPGGAPYAYMAPFDAPYPQSAPAPYPVNPDVTGPPNYGAPYPTSVPGDQGHVSGAGDSQEKKPTGNSYA